jgi:2-keto-3-deoxy-L-rhamnonate aldolase RhmA
MTSTDPIPVPSLKTRLREGHVLLGPLLFELATPGLAVMLADVGFDFLLFDLEHAPFDAPTVARTMLAARQAGLGSIVKLPDCERSGVQRYLDYGAAGIQVPHVESPDELRQLVRWARYPPAGERSQVFGLGNTGFRVVDFNAHVARANEETLLIPMIETRRGVETIEATLSTEGADVVFIGTGDLSSSYGVPGQLTHPVVVDAAERVSAACRAHDVPVAIYADEPKSARHWIDRGIQMIAYSTELDMIRRQAVTLLAPLKSVRRRSPRKS